MAQAPLTTSKMFTAKWTERDEAVLVDLLKRKIHEIKWEIHESDSPYARAKLTNPIFQKRVISARLARWSP